MIIDNKSRNGKKNQHFFKLGTLVQETEPKVFEPTKGYIGPVWQMLDPPHIREVNI